MAKVWMGTSGFAYKEWKPSLLSQGGAPATVPGVLRLPVPGSRNRLYVLQDADSQDPGQLEGPHAGRLPGRPEGARLSEDYPLERLHVPSEALDYLLETLPRLEDRLGIVLYQLPPNFKLDLERLEYFLAGLPKEIASAFEFRHES